MNRLATISIIVAGAAAVYGQAPLVNTGPRTPVVNTGVGNIGHVQNLGTSVSGIGPKDYGFRGGRPGVGGGRFDRTQTVIVPYGIPVYYGGDAYGYAQQQQQQPNITVVVPPQQTPTVIINQNYTPERANPVLRDYSDAELPPPSNGRQSDVRIYQAPAGAGTANRDPEADKPTIFLIAMKDGSIHSAIGYWTEGKTFGYVTPNASVNRISMDQLDIEMTEQLNRDRKVPFDLKRE
jgi:hypothetical protein